MQAYGLSPLTSWQCSSIYAMGPAHLVISVAFGIKSNAKQSSSSCETLKSDPHLTPLCLSFKIHDFNMHYIVPPFILLP